MNRSGTRINAVMAEIQSRIASRTYLPGTRLPSVRAQARAMQVSVSTVVEAYERLTAEGVIASRPGSGFYVAGPVAPLTLTQIGPKLDREVDPLWVSRQSLETGATTLKPGCGWLPAAWLYETGMRRALRALARAETLELAEYATPLGHPALRQFLSRRLASAGIEAVPEQIMLTESGTQAIDLICRFLLEPGDTVLVDDPCYFNFHALLKAHRVQVVGVPYTPHGPDVERFTAALQEHSPRLYITNSGIHNPTGATLSPVIAHRLLKLADSCDLVIVEDDIFADFEANPAPRLAAFDGLSRVIHIGSFSKTVSASLRCGYIATQTNWIESLVDLKIATSFGGGRLAADMVLMALTDSGYRKHMETVRSRLAEEMVRTIARLEAIGITPWIVPQAGMFLWCRLPEGIDAAAIARSCLKDGVVLAPGNAFSQSLSAHDFLRFNVAQSTDDRIFEILARALSER
ncbi:PLP-dependent aminotransferase family protein [Pseudomonas amygdali]|uniref:aminotransferase-like domain-containing protein n=1 Tax=Pseudomonas amygdali TaxID=47877 RepID=UPI001FB6DED1|nr:PLP-dependent aminotransferase family protein [Pseudomonas amygdali]UPT39858.1 PLP-dependent aminotransferase family protein [Pseudomonas amygdali pv. loropetali]